MPKLDLKDLSPEVAKQLLVALKKDIQSLENDKIRLAKQCDEFQEEVNEHANKLDSIKKTLAEKEKELMEKVKKKEALADAKLKELNEKTAEASAREDEAATTVKQNKKAEESYKQQAALARTSNEENAKTKNVLEELAQHIKDTIKII